MIESLSTSRPNSVTRSRGDSATSTHAPICNPRDRQLVTLGMLTALGGCEPQLEVHIGAALNVGLQPEQIIEAFLHASAYCGFPKAPNAVAVARKVHRPGSVKRTV